MMDKIELDHLFDQVCDKPESPPLGTRLIFDVLIETTVDYRDSLVRAGDSLTVGETKSALEGLLWYFRTGEIPKELGRKITHLIKSWVYNLTEYTEPKESIYK